MCSGDEVVYKDPESLSNLSLQTLLSLRDIGRDDLRRTEKHAADLKEMLANIKREIECRGNRTSG